MTDTPTPEPTAPDRIWVEPDTKGYCITGVWPWQPSARRNVKEYTRADIPAARIAETEDEIERLEAENARLREVLSSYAGKTCPNGVVWEPLNDNGHAARTALNKDATR